MNPSAGSLATEVEVHDGARAIEVQASYRGLVTDTRHLFDVDLAATETKARVMLSGGIAAIVLGLGVCFAVALDVGAERQLYQEHLAAGQDGKTFPFKHRTPGPDIVAFLSWVAGLALICRGFNHQGTKQHDYTIGSDAHSDAPVGPEFAGTGSHVLVSIVGRNFRVNVTPQMQGDVAVGGHLYPLASFVREKGASFALPDDARARVVCGESAFVINSTPKPRALDVPFLVWKWSEQVYTVGAAVGLLLLLGVIFSVPPDPKSLSLDLFNADDHFVTFLIKPPVEKPEEIPPWLTKAGAHQPGGTGKRHKGDEGEMGKKTAKNKKGQFAIRGPKDNTDPHLAKIQTEEAVKTAGILGILKATEGSHIASILGRETALGSNPDNVLGGLIGTRIDEASGIGGLRMLGTGHGGGGPGEGTIGLDTLGTIGKGGGGPGSGPGYGRGIGLLGPRRTKFPEITTGAPNIRGSLDKEIIRRIIRRHINEVRYCYEQELIRKANLGGRVAVAFTIAATGKVVTSVAQDSTLSNARVESCVVQAVGRWEFPKPSGGGIVIVTYPFQFTPAGGASE